MMKEIIIKDFPNYSVSVLGEIRNINTGKTLVGGTDLGGYKIVTLRKNGKNYTKTVHRLVALAFIPNPLNLPCINHKDENKQNNAVENLEWCTYKYNNNYGTFLKRRSKSRYKKVCRYDLQGNYIDDFSGIVVASSKTHVNQSNIISVCNGKRKSAGGYMWRYDNG